MICIFIRGLMKLIFANWSPNCQHGTDVHLPRATLPLVFRLKANRSIKGKYIR